jgi:uncharacterized protein (TIGR02300 family)
MPAKDLGLKHTCWKCSTKFYDLKKPNPVCPKCGADPREAPVAKPPSPAERRRVKEEPVEEVAEVVEEADLEEEVDDAAEDEPEEAGSSDE